jgi:hypothetical protein
MAMSREQFIQAARRVHSSLYLVLLLTACAAIGLGFALPAWAGLREWLLAHRGEGAVQFLVGMLAAGVVLGALLLVPFLSFLWVDRRFGLRCPGCKRSVTLPSRHREVLRSGRCCRCQQALFEPGDE